MCVGGRGGGCKLYSELMNGHIFAHLCRVGEGGQKCQLYIQ